MLTARKPSTTISSAEMHQQAGDAMREHFKILKAKGNTKAARTPEEFYGFRPVDVAAMHFRKHGFGRGLWYRLKDGRVFDALAKPSEPGAEWYVTAAH